MQEARSADPRRAKRAEAFKGGPGGASPRDFFVEQRIKTPDSLTDFTGAAILALKDVVRMDDFTLRTSDLLILIGACTNWCAGQKCGVGGVPTPAAGLPPPRAHPLRALLPPRASERAVVDVVQRANG